MLCYTQALKTANEKRTTRGAWGSPVRHFAEKRHVKKFENFLREKLGEPLSDENPRYKEVHDLAKDQSVIANAKFAVSSASMKALLDDKKPEPAGRHSIRIHEAGPDISSQKSEQVKQTTSKTKNYEKQ